MDARRPHTVFLMIVLATTACSCRGVEADPTASPGLPADLAATAEALAELDSGP